jgi:Uncharacterised lipoprotein
VTWTEEETGRRRAFAMSTPLKTVVMTAGSIDDGEYEQLLPAFLLAKQSLTRWSVRAQHEPATRAGYAAAS